MLIPGSAGRRTAYHCDLEQDREAERDHLVVGDAKCVLVLFVDGP
jgi:hypothetical protein